jgi:hypothetical protein
MSYIVIQMCYVPIRTPYIFIDFPILFRSYIVACSVIVVVTSLLLRLRCSVRLYLFCCCVLRGKVTCIVLSGIVRLFVVVLLSLLWFNVYIVCICNTVSLCFINSLSYAVCVCRDVRYLCVMSFLCVTTVVLKSF